MRRSLSIAVTLCLVGGCDLEAVPPSGLALERDVARARCEALRRPECSMQVGTTSVEQCADAHVMRASLARARAVNEGRIVIDAADLDACLLGFDCVRHTDDPFATALACERMFVGTVGPGSACRVDEECVVGHFCRSDAAAGCDVCVPRLELGEPCGFFDKCIEPSGPGDDVRNVCVEGACARVRAQPVPEGARCGLEPGDGELRFRRCPIGTTCVESTDGTRCMGSGQPEGAPCVVGIDTCAGDLVCDSAGRCAPNARVVVATVGAPCGGAVSTPTECDARVGLTCVAGACELVPGLGDACDGSSAIPCEPGLVCGGTAICTPPLRLGGACDGDHDCSSMSCEPSGQCVSSALCSSS